MKRFAVPSLVRALQARRFCAGTEARRLWRWGATDSGFLTQSEAPEKSTQPSLGEEKGIETAACGSSHSAFVAAGRLYAYGSNKYSQLGRDVSGPSTQEPVHIEIDLPVRQVALGAFHSACVCEDGSLFTWGWGGGFFHGAGALGLGHGDSVSSPHKVDQFTQHDQKIDRVACGAQHTLVLTTDGHLYATGKGDFGRLGRGDTSDEYEFHEIDYFEHTDDSILAPGEMAKIVKIDAGENFSAAMSQQGELWVWGRNDYGQLGLGEEAMGDMYSAERFPRLVRSLPSEGHRIVDFACGEHHVVLLTSEGVLFEWGDRTWLEPHRVSPPQVKDEDFRNIVKVAAGDKYSFALTATGKLYTWGSKGSGCMVITGDGPKNVVEPTLISPEVFQHQKLVDIVASKGRCLAISDEGAYVS